MAERTNNLLLQWLSLEDYERLAGRMQTVEHPRGKILYDVEDEVDYVYFPERGLISIISILISGATVETAIVGCEGAVGFIEACGSGLMLSRCLVQASGVFQRATAKAYCEALAASASMRGAVNDHIELLLTESRQTIACQSLHPAEQRLAWWLLEAQDRMADDSGHLPLTQEMLAAMLGVRRSTVTEVAHKLQDRGLIRYRRGDIEICDRKGLEKAACECYATIRGFRRRIETLKGHGGA